MQTLANGLQVPDIDDTGDIVFPAMVANLVLLDPLLGSVLGVTTQDIDSGDWIARPNDLFRQLVTMPDGLTFDATIMQFRLEDGSPFFPTVTKQSENQYYIYINDSSVSVVAVYRA